MPCNLSWQGLDLPDGVTSPQTNPLRDRTVLLLRSGKLLLGAERLMALLVSDVSVFVVHTQNDHEDPNLRMHRPRWNLQAS